MTRARLTAMVLAIETRLLERAVLRWIRHCSALEEQSPGVAVSLATAATNEIVRRLGSTFAATHVPNALADDAAFRPRATWLAGTANALGMQGLPAIDPNLN